MLQKLTVKNFKRFREETVIDLAPITVLVGANNSGKSTVLQALSIFQYCVEVTRKKKNGTIALETRTIGPEEFGALPVASPTDLWPNGKATGTIAIGADFDGAARIRFEIKLSYNRFSIAPSVEGDVPAIMDGARIRYVPIHSGLALREEYLLAPARADRLRELQYGSVIRNLLWDLKENERERWKLLKGILARLYPLADIDVAFDKEVDRFIATEYNDHILSRPLDVVASGTGFQQVLQIFSGVLSQGNCIVLLDEPDAHLHARMQVELMRVFEDLADERGIQFVMATHSAHLLAAAPPGSLRAMIDGRAHPFATTPEQIDVLDTLGAFDRMEIVPLLRTKAIVFVENREDRNLLELFARKLWGDKKAREVWDRVCFLYTYQEPIAADVKLLARQVKDLLNAPSLSDLAGGRQPRFLVVGDRDYRRATSVAREKRELHKSAKSAGLKLDLRCHIWSRNEIENYLLDRHAVEKVVVANLDDSTKASAARTAVREALVSSLSESRSEAGIRIATKLQHEDRRLDYTKATHESDDVLNAEWGDGAALCDAKRVLSRIRGTLQERKIRTRLLDEDIIAAMATVPEEVKQVLNMIKRLAASGSKRKAHTRHKPVTKGKSSEGA
ncbi:MAG: ATP-binding protein [Deltaproteobacteria bacterium]|nr:ATP-binding protein [Deltaproteobacteria bacterium]